MGAREKGPVESGEKDAFMHVCERGRVEGDGRENCWTRTEGGGGNRRPQEQQQQLHRESKRVERGKEFWKKSDETGDWRVLGCVFV